MKELLKIWLETEGRYANRYWCLYFENGKSYKKLYYRFIWEQANGPIPKGYEIHHKNFNHQDDRIENLDMLTHEDHMKLHDDYKRGKTYEELYGEEKAKQMIEEKSIPYEERWGSEIAKEISERKSKSMKGKNTGPKSEETKKKISESHKGKESSFKGKTHSEESRRLNSEKLKAKWQDPEFREKMKNRKKPYSS